MKSKKEGREGSRGEQQEGPEPELPCKPPVAGVGGKAAVTWMNAGSFSTSARVSPRV